MREKIVNFFTVSVAFLTLFQGLITGLPIHNAATLTLISAITMFLVSTLTVWKQKLSEEINSKAIWPTIIVAAIATVGGINDTILPVLHFSEIAAQWIRFGITFITLALNLASKIFYPTAKTQSVV